MSIDISAVKLTGTYIGPAVAKLSDYAYQVPVPPTLTTDQTGQLLEHADDCTMTSIPTVDWGVVIAEVEDRFEHKVDVYVRASEKTKATQDMLIYSIKTTERCLREWPDIIHAIVQGAFRAYGRWGELIPAPCSPLPAAQLSP